MPMKSSVPARLRRAALLTGATLAGLTLAAPAVANGYTISDPTGDQVRMSDTTTQFGTTTTDTTTGPDAASDHRNGDITSFSVSHNKRRLVASMSMVDFAVPPPSSTSTGESETMGGALLEVRTRAPRRSFEVLGLFDGTRGYWVIVNERKGKPVRCRGFQHTVGADHTVTFSIPRRCLGGPHRLRVAAGSVIDQTTSTSHSDSDVTYLDDAQSAAYNADVPTFGPWLHRG